jgi:hypothetical protein
VLEAVDRVGRLVVPLALRLFMAGLPAAPIGAIVVAAGLATRLVAAVLFVGLAGASAAQRPCERDRRGRRDDR